ncbi:MAG: outer membrane lipoprotein-sorting protein [Acidobacteria bacterium]|nr:MAG: outer membrane lipoprotein-sorting protein [Acidobacteriota bacterium]
MFRQSLAICISLACANLLAVAQDTPRSRVKLSAADIADKNVAARGGLQAWRAVQTMSLAGKLGAGGNQRAALPVPIQGRKSGQKVALPSRPAEEVQLPFVMELQRPRKMRFELQFNGQTAIQVFDGATGWKLRPFLNRRVVEPYTTEEMKTASMQADLDGPLVDYAAKGTRVELAGMEKVEDRDTYKLKLTMKDGQATHVWIDAQTFLEAKIEGQPRRLDGTYHPVEVYFRDYRPVNGLQIPFVLETKVLPVAQTALGLKDPLVPAEKTIIDTVVVNPKLDESLFSKPQIEVASNAR